MDLVIAQTWDGKPLARTEQVELCLQPMDDCLEITLHAPYGGGSRPPGSAGPCWGLWAYEVVEVFILGGESCYTEIELGPHGHHLVLQLEGERNVVASGLPLEYSASIDGKRWSGHARLDRRLLPAPPHWFNAYAIRGVGGTRVHHAFSALSGTEPDFHRLECFRDIGSALAATASGS